MLEVQRHLQADRQIEVLQKQIRADKELLDPQDVGAGHTTSKGEGVKQR